MNPNPTITTDPDGDIIITVFPGTAAETEIHIEQGDHPITEDDISFNADAGLLTITAGDHVERHDLSFILQAS